MNKPLLKELLKLSPAERLEIVHELWESLSPDDLPELTEEQFQELERRATEHRRYPSRAIPVEDVLARLRARYK